MMRQTVLLVDDDHLLLQMYGQQLANDEFEVVTAPSGEACLRLLEERTPAAIVLDLMMPGLDGFGVLERLSRHPDWRHIPVLVFSTRGAPEDIDTALDLGATDYIVKTQSTPRDLAEKVCHLLGRQPGTNDARRLCVAIDRGQPTSGALQLEVGLLCPKCQAPMLLDIVMAVADARDFTGSFICPNKCV